MIKTIFYARHGETEWNRIGRFQGHSDIPLNENGLSQARQLQILMNGWRPEVFVSSDLIRAQQTARIANSNLQVPHLIDHRLREIHLGVAEGKTLVEVESLFGQKAIQDWVSPHPDLSGFSFPEGETKLDSVLRIKSFLETLLVQLPYSTVAVVGHGGTLKRFCHHIAEDKTKAFPIPNCCVYQIQFNVLTREWSNERLISPL